MTEIALFSRPRRNDGFSPESIPSLRHYAPEAPRRRKTSQVGGPGASAVSAGAVWDSLDRGMALHLGRVAPATEELEVRRASECGFSFVISYENTSGSGLHGPPGLIAAWRPIYINRHAIRGRLPKPDNACNALLGHLTR